MELEERGIPKLVLPPPIPVRPPKYTYAEFLEEERPLKEKWDEQFESAEDLSKRIDEIKIQLPILRKELAKVKKDQDILKSEKKEESDRITSEIESLKDELEESISAKQAHIIAGNDIRQPWRDEQRRRWEHGHAGLLGIHYLYLTQFQIKNALGKFIRPVWRDGDEMVLEDFMWCLKNGKDFYVFKRREFGLSSIFGGLVPFWLILMNPGGVFLMTSADLGRVSDLISEKFMAQHGQMEDWVAPLKKTYDRHKGATLAEVDKDGVETGNVAEIKCRQTSQDKKDATNLEGARAIGGFLDELFLHPFPEEVRGSVKSCLMAGMKRVGILVAGGSANAISRLGLKQAREIWESQKTNAVKCLFLKGSICISEADIVNEHGEIIGTENFCINGWSDHARAEAYIRWQREMYDLSPSKKDLNAFIKTYPLDIDEVFQSDEVGVIPKDVADLIPDQELELKNNPRNLRRISITDNGMGSISFVNDPKGFWLISEPPVKGMTYEMGTDCIPMLMDKKEMTLDPDATEHSKHCSFIKCVETNSYVAMLLLRTSDEKLIYEQTMLGQLLYNGCLNMFERNRGDVLYLEYKNAGTLAMLAFQPVWIGSKGYKKNTMRGVYKDGNNTEKIYNAGFSYFRENMQNVDFPIILEQLRSFGLENADVIDAIFMCEVLSRGRAVSDGKRAMAVMKIKPRKVAYTTTDEFGRRVTRYREVMSEKDREDYEAMMGGMQPITGF